MTKPFANPSSREAQDFDIFTTNLAAEFPGVVDNLAACLEQWLGCKPEDFEGEPQQARAQVHGHWEAAYKELHAADEHFGPKGGRGLTEETRKGFFDWIRPQMTQAKIEERWLEPLRDRIALRISNGATDSFQELSSKTTLDEMKAAFDHAAYLFTPMTREGLEIFLKQHGDPKGEIVQKALAWKTGKDQRISQYGYVLHEVQGILDEYLHREIDPAESQVPDEPPDSPEPEPQRRPDMPLVEGDWQDEPGVSDAPDLPSQEIVLFDPNIALAHVTRTSDLINAMLNRKLLVESHKDDKGNEVDGDYGKIAGSKKPALFKSGAEKLCEAFGLVPEFIPLADSVSDWKDGFFYFHYKCELRRIGTGELVATANGSCNSREDKYGWRWVEKDKVPANLNVADLDVRPSKISAYDFAVTDAKTEGDYAKPAEYWKMFQDAIDAGTAVRVEDKKNKAGKMMYKWVIDGSLYRIPNRDIYSIVNTLDKMAQKRALVAATLIGTAASRFFTQDIEDLVDYGTVA